MPRIEVNGTEIHYEEYGTGSETIVFAHGLLWSCRIFDEQVLLLQDYYRCIAFDFRGHGQSDVTESGYDMDTLTEDVITLIELLNCKSCHFVGLSMGGFIGMRIAIRRPELIKSLVLIGTTADPEPLENLGRYKRLNFLARWFGLGIIANPVMSILFGQKFLNDRARTELKETWRQHLIANNRFGISRAVNGVISRDGIINQLGTINAPTLIMVGDQDVATTREKSERMQKCIQGAELTIISGAGHTATVEEPESVNAMLQKFLSC